MFFNPPPPPCRFGINLYISQPVIVTLYTFTLNHVCLTVQKVSAGFHQPPQHTVQSSVLMRQVIRISIVSPSFCQMKHPQQSVPAGHSVGICLLFPPTRNAVEVAIKCLVVNVWRFEQKSYPSAQPPITQNWDQPPQIASNRNTKQPGKGFTCAAADLRP